MGHIFSQSSQRLSRRPIVGLIGCVLLALGGCGRPVVAPLLLPLSVDEMLPTDIDRSEVNRDPDGCYFYTYAAELIVVRDRDGQPICIQP